MESVEKLLATEYKTYIAVHELRREDGTILPRVIVWEDGTKYAIERVLDIRPAASLKAGGVGLRYEVSVEGKRTYMWLEEDRWFVERRRAKAEAG
jgi:hypothetical protein